MLNCTDCKAEATKEEADKYNLVKSIFNPFRCRKCYRLRMIRKNSVKNK